MLILILIHVKYLQNVVFSFEKGSNRQNHSSTGFHHLAKKISSKISDLPPTYPLPLLGKPCSLIPEIYFPQCLFFSKIIRL